MPAQQSRRTECSVDQIRVAALPWAARVFSTTATGAVIAAVPAVFYAASLIRKNSYDQGTALFAGEAVVNDIVLMVVTKVITRRQRPTERLLAAPYNDTFFHSNGSIFGKSTSFPSGHAMMAFSVATIFARRYKDHRWVPYVAYALAGAIAFSRVTTSEHFPADAFFGSSMGYVIARYEPDGRLYSAAGDPKFPVSALIRLQKSLFQKIPAPSEYALILPSCWPATVAELFPEIPSSTRCGDPRKEVEENTVDAFVRSTEKLKAPCRIS